MKVWDLIFTARIIAAIIILWFLDLEKLALILQSINLDLIILAILLELMGFLVWTAKWKFLVDRLEKIRFSTLFLGLMAGNCLQTNVLRARTFGGFGRASFVQSVTQNHKYANWYAIIVIDLTTNNFVFSLLAMFSILFVFLFMNIPLWLSIFMETIVLFIFVLALAAFLSKQRFKRTDLVQFFHSNLQRIYNFPSIKSIRDRFDSYKKFEDYIVLCLTEFENTYRSTIKNRTTLTRDLGLSVIMYGFIYFKAYVLFQSVEYEIYFLDLIVSLSLILWINSIIAIPWGFGVKEVVMISIYTMVGVPITISFIVSLMDRVIYLFFVIIIAYLAITFIRVFHICTKQDRC